MAVTRTQKVNLGIFIAVSAALLIGGIVALVGMKLWEDQDTYTLRFDSKTVSMSGLDIGSPVKYSGIQIGRVMSISIDTQDVSSIIVAIDVKGGTPITTDSTATLGSIGITGLKYIELSGGTPGQRLRSSGEEIPTAPSLMDEITGKAGIIAQKTEYFLNKINDFLSESRQKEFWDTVASVRQLVTTTEQTLSTSQPELANLTKKLSSLAGEVDEMAANLNDVLSKSGPEVSALVSSTRLFMDELRLTRTNLDGLIVESQTLMNAMNRNMGEKGMEASITKLNSFLDRATLFIKQSEEEFGITLENLREASANLDEFSLQIKENPSMLLRSPDSQEREIR